MRAETVNDCYVALELSQRTWLIGHLLPSPDKVQTVTVAGGNAESLLSALAKIETLAECPAGSMRVCFEAGYDGFGFTRLLMDRGIHTTIFDPSDSVALTDWFEST